MHVLSVGVSNFTTKNYQLSFLSDYAKASSDKDKTTSSIDDVMDSIKEKHGDFSIVHATMLGGEDFVPDRIAFGK